MGVAGASPNTRRWRVEPDMGSHMNIMGSLIDKNGTAGTRTNAGSHSRRWMGPHKNKSGEAGAPLGTRTNAGLHSRRWMGPHKNKSGEAGAPLGEGATTGPLNNNSSGLQVWIGPHKNKRGEVGAPLREGSTIGPLNNNSLGLQVWIGPHKNKSGEAGATLGEGSTKGPLNNDSSGLQVWGEAAGALISRPKGLHKNKRREVIGASIGVAGAPLRMRPTFGSLTYKWSELANTCWAGNGGRISSQGAITLRPKIGPLKGINKDAGASTGVSPKGACWAGHRGRMGSPANNSARPNMGSHSSDWTKGIRKGSSYPKGTISRSPRRPTGRLKAEGASLGSSGSTGSLTGVRTSSAGSTAVGRSVSPRTSTNGGAGESPGARTVTNRYEKVNRVAVASQGSGMDTTGIESIKVVQVNLNKGRAATAELNNVEFDVALIQEPNIGRKATISLIELPKRSYCKETARAAVVIGERVKYWPVESLSSRDLAVIAIVLERGVLFLASGYQDITMPVVSPEMNRLQKYCRDERIPLIIGMDSNAHSTVWGEEESNPRGVELEQWLMEMEMNVENKGRIPTFTPLNGSRSTIIDLTITNDRALDLVRDWSVDMTPSLSDHRRITYELTVQLKEQVLQSRNYRKANWEEFTRALEKIGLHWSQKASPDEVEELAECLLSNLQEALDVTAPIRTRSLKPARSWWTEKLALQRCILRNVYKQRYVHSNHMQKYKELKKELGREIKKARQESWQTFCSRAESAKDIAKLVQILENPPARLMSLLEGQTVLTPERSLEHLLRVHFPDGVLEEGITADDADNTRDTDFTGVCQYINYQKVEAAFESFGDFKSPGPDELPPIALKSLPHQYREMMATLYRLTIASGKLPTWWKKMKVVFLPKAGKEDYAVAKSYRPITLSNFVLKGLERIIQWFILEYTITKPLTNQHAYTKGRSCDSALSCFVNDVERAIYNGQHLLAVSLDCSGAFDNIRFEAARRCMETQKIPYNIIRWYTNLLKSRSVLAQVQGIQKTIKPSRGSPQGGVLSPLVWNIIMDSFLSQYRKGPVKALGYADDILLYVTGKDMIVMEEFLQEAMDKVLEWGNLNGLSFNPKKTQMVLFTSKRKLQSPKIGMGDLALELKDSFKYLGVEIHKKLSWTKHVTDRVNKCRGLLFKCKGIINRRWGLNPAKVDWIYKAIIRPKVTYGAVVWGASLTAGLKRRLSGLQRLALVAMTQPPRSVPTAGLEAMMGWTPLDLHVQETGLNTFSRLHKCFSPKWDHIGTGARMRGHLGLWNRELSKQYPIGYPREVGITRWVWAPNNNIRQVKDAPKDTLNVYTDAAKSGEDVGCGWCVCDGDHILAEDSIPCKEINVYQAEVLGIKEALSWIKNSTLANKVFKIWTDSRGAVASLGKCATRDYLTRETKCLLSELKEHHEIEVIWTKGHNNNTGNEVADMLAKEGLHMAGNMSYAAPFMTTCQGQVKSMIREIMLGKWQRRWEQLDQHVVSKLFVPKVGPNKRVSLLSIKELSKLTQIVTGHGLFKRHMRHWNDLGDIQCALCGEDVEYSWHLWEWCPRLKGDRERIRYLQSRGMPFEMALLKFFNQQELVELTAHNEALIET